MGTFRSVNEGAHLSICFSRRIGGIVRATGRNVMKGLTNKRDAKKAPAKSMKEKKAAKEAKKAAKRLP